MIGRARLTRGKPVRAMLVLLGGWVVLRAALWQSPFAAPDLQPQLIAQTGMVVTPASLGGHSRAHDAKLFEAARMPVSGFDLAPVQPILQRPRDADQIDRPASAGSAAPAERQPGLTPLRHIVGHNLLLAAGLSRMELDPALLAYIQGAGPRAAQPAGPPSPAFAPVAAERFARETGQPRRWSMDAWAMWREDENSPLLSGRPSYGRSQIGAVLRFRLAPSSGHAPQAYVRASAALAGAREQQGALGLSARPLPGVPVRLAGEARLRQTGGDAELRGAAYAVSEFPPLPLPGGTTGEAYVQGGYVTGTAATGFVDGQARITRDLASGDRFRLSAGAGAWGGAQEGSGRLDIGPSASLSVSAGGVNARVSADYRIRVAGAAQPATGPALTISAGF